MLVKLYFSIEQPVKLIDFGCSFDMDEGIDGGAGAAGTAEFMAPEVWFTQMLYHSILKPPMPSPFCTGNVCS